MACYSARRRTTARPWRRRLLALAALPAALAWLPAAPSTAAAPRVNFAGELEYDGQSQYSHIRIRRRGSVRTMLFVRDSGEEAIESQIDLRRPHFLQLEYLRFMFASYLLREQQQDVLIVGLGGGGMVHFLRQTDPEVNVDVVEIDPEVVRLADAYFSVRTGGRVNIVTADGLEFIADAEKRYDAIYMDAFLKPSVETDGTGSPLALRTQQFYKQLQEKLKPGGVVLFNLNPHPELGADVAAISEAFPQTYVFPLSLYGGAVVAGSIEAERVDPRELVRRGEALDRRFKTDLSFTELARRLRR